MKFPVKMIFVLNTILLAVLLVHSVYRDLILQRQYQYAPDLRNRVVGSRLIKDRKLPYSYAWHPTDGIRYFDVNNRNTGTGTSDITASPFFHQLFIPLFELPQKTVSIIWFWLQYLFLFGMIVMTCALTGNKKIKWLIINFAILFTVTEAWKDLIAEGQLYLFVGFLMNLIIFLLIRKTKFSFLLAGILAAGFVLTRPIGIVFFIPFLFYQRKFIYFLGTAFSMLLIYGLFILLSPYQKALYQDYIYSIKSYMHLHLDENRESFKTQTLKIYPFSNLEEIDIKEVDRANQEPPIRVSTERGNFFVLYNKITHSKISLVVLNTISIFTILLLSVLFFLHIRKNPAVDLQLLLFGFTLYMIVELYGPIYRSQYNTVQWFPLVLTGFLMIRDWMNIVFLLLSLGLFLNITNFHWLPMRHTLGEICWLAAILMLVFSSRTKQVT
jgi:Glycosyltransferase family 87